MFGITQKSYRKMLNRLMIMALTLLLCSIGGGDGGSLLSLLSVKDYRVELEGKLEKVTCLIRQGQFRKARNKFKGLKDAKNLWDTELSKRSGIDWNFWIKTSERLNERINQLEEFWEHEENYESSSPLPTFQEKDNNEGFEESESDPGLKQRKMFQRRRPRTQFSNKNSPRRGGKFGILQRKNYHQVKGGSHDRNGRFQSSPSSLPPSLSSIPHYRIPNIFYQVADLPTNSWLQIVYSTLGEIIQLFKDHKYERESICKVHNPLFRQLAQTYRQYRVFFHGTFPTIGVDLWKVSCRYYKKAELIINRFCLVKTTRL